jgi:hypothetical protein
MTTSPHQRAPRRIAAAMSVTLFWLALLCGHAAASGPAFAVEPLDAGAYFVFDAHPGETLHGRVRVVNVGGAAGLVRLYAADATTGPTSGASYLADAPRRSDVGAWTALSIPRADLRPGESRVVPFTVRVPAQVRPGDHLGGIVADGGIRQSPLVKRRGSAFRVNLRTLTVIAVEARLPGPQTERMSIDGIHAGGMRGYQQLFLSLANTGNVLLKGSGSLTVSNPAGRQLKHSSFSLDTFVPRTRIDYPVFVHGTALPSGSYVARITLHYRGHTISRTFGFKIAAGDLKQVFGSRAPTGGLRSSLPLWLLIAAGVGLLVLGFALAWAYFRRRERRIAMLLRERDRAELELLALRADDAGRGTVASPLDGEDDT